MILPAQALLMGDANEDGVVNAADHAFVQAVIHRRIAATAAADVDGDGEVTERDAAAVADLILGQTPFLYQGTGEIPATGGEVVAGDLTLVAANGALPVTAQLFIAAAEQFPAYEGEDDSPLYRIDGVPTRYGAGLTVSLPLASRRASRTTAWSLICRRSICPHPNATRTFPRLSLFWSAGPLASRWTTARSCR
jgi:hypothetical protein